MRDGDGPSATPAHDSLPHQPGSYYGSSYDDFGQTTEEEIARLLDQAEMKRTDATLPTPKMA